jgi:hypothetical protein
MNLNELYNENKNPFQDVVDKVAAKEKQADAEHTKGLKDIADKFQSAEKKSSEEFSKKLRADEAKDTHCSDKCCGSDVKAEDCNCPPTCKHCDCNAIVSESQLDELTGWTQAAPKRAAPQPKKSTFAELIKKSDDKRSALQRQKDGGKKNWFAEDQGVAEGWQEDSQELEDWSKEVNKRLYRAHESQRPALARQLSKIEQKQFGSSLNQGSLTELVHSALKALRKGGMVHYDPQSVGQMPFGSIVGDDARIIAAAGVSSDELVGYRMLSDKGIVDNIQQFLKLRRVVWNKNWPPEYLDKFAGRPGALWLQFVKDLDWSKDDMNEEVQAKTDDKLLAYYAQRKAEKQKTADRKEQRTQTQQQARDAFGNMFGGGNPADKLKIKEQGVAESQFDPINDDDFYEYNVNTNKIVKRISGKHPIARQFSPMQKEWAGRDADHKIVKGMYAKQLKPTVDEKVSDYLPAPLVNKHSIVKGWRKARGLDEKAPPGDKAERMVKHIKKNYSKDGKLTPTEKSIAYATAWKAHNAGKV